MSGPHILLQLDPCEGESHKGASLSRAYQPGESLTGHYQIALDLADDFRAVELSALWYTIGQGEEDFGVHFFERHAGDDQAQFEVGQQHPFSMRLPSSPLSYQGLIVNLQWCVRVRLFLLRGKEVVEEVSFQLADVPQAEAMPD